MRKIILATGGALLMSSSLAMADIVGFGANATYWDSDLSGKAGTDGDFVDVESDLDLSSDSNVNLDAYIEHPVPLLPNVRLNYTRIEQSGFDTLSVQFDDIVAGADVNSDLEINQLDLTLYYEILDNWVNLDVGLTARNLDGELVVRQSGGPNVSRAEFDGVVPMGYLAARFDLPFTGVSVGGDVNAISYSGDSVSDFNAYGQYEISLVQLRLGYRKISIDVEDGDDRLDVELGGPFASVGLTF